MKISISDLINLLHVILQSDNGLVVIVHQDETLFRKERNNLAAGNFISQRK
jgi:hypothetical protein